jgi:hypothetical protein
MHSQCLCDRLLMHHQIAFRPRFVQLLLKQLLSFRLRMLGHSGWNAKKETVRYVTIIKDSHHCQPVLRTGELVRR